MLFKTFGFQERVLKQNLARFAYPFVDVFRWFLSLSSLGMVGYCFVRGVPLLAVVFARLFVWFNPYLSNRAYQFFRSVLRRLLLPQKI
jgi:hypothetical protein